MQQRNPLKNGTIAFMSRKRSDSKRPSVRAAARTSAERRRAHGGYGVNSGQDGLRVSLPGGEELLLTRRHFLYGLTGLAALAVVGGSSYALDQMSIAETSERVLSVTTDSVLTTDDCTFIDAAANPVKLQHELQLPYGTQAWSSTDNTAACLIPTDSANPITQAAVLTLGNGARTTVLERAVSADEGYEIYDVRACDNGMVWVEANILKDVWRVYQAPLTVGTTGLDSRSATSSAAPTLGEAHLCAEGGGDWEMPTIAAVGAHAFWQELPRLDGEAKNENSLMKRVRFGSPSDAEPEIVCMSEGRFATPLSATATGVVAAPRTAMDTVNYQLTYFDAATGSIEDTLILPASMRPLEASYGRTGFMFAFDGIYDYGGGIANLGTYVPLDKAGSQTEDPIEAAAHYGASEWFRFPRTPTAAPCWCGPYVMVKSTSAVCGTNLDSREYFALDVHDGANDFGDHLATTGMGNRIVTFSNIDYTPLNGAQEKYSLVRIWGA